MNRLFPILRRNMLLFVVSALAFAAGIPFGALIYPFVSGSLPGLLDSVFGGVMSGSTAEVILKVFLRNVSASAIIMLFGMTVVLAVLALSLNGVFVGLVFMFALDRGLGLTHLIFGVIPHSLFELPALFLSAGFGMRVGLQLVTCSGCRLKAASSAIREASAVYLLVVLPLLAVAAAVEILISKNLIS